MRTKYKFDVTKRYLLKCGERNMSAEEIYLKIGCSPWALYDMYRFFKIKHKKKTYDRSKNYGNCKGKNNGMFGKHHSKQTKIKIGKRNKFKRRTKKHIEALILGLKTKLSKHHLDLNTHNNKKENFYYLTNANHQRFHRLAYHYLLEKFGMKEILEYRSWFEKNILKTKYIKRN